VTKKTEGEDKSFEEIERLVSEQASQDRERVERADPRLNKEAAKKAKEQAKKAAKEAERAKKEAEKLARASAKEEARNAKQAKNGAAPEADSATLQGNFQLVLPTTAGFKQVRQFSESLANIADLKTMWTGGSVDEGALIVISVAQPLPLARILSDIPMVERVEVKGDKVNITFKAA